MKKVFLLLAAVGLAFASCTPDGGGDKTGNEGAGEFAIEVTNITPTAAHIKVTAKEATRSFYANVMSKADFASFDINEHYAELVEAVDAGQYTWEQLLNVGTSEWDTSRVTPDKEFVAYAYGVDANGNLTSTAVSYKSFKSPASTFDTTQWVGWWEVTSPKTYVQQTNPLTEKYEEAWTDDELIRPIQIVDGLTEHESLEGYAVVYGWDGNFLYDGPAIGVYNDNKIELLNNEIVYEDAEQGLVYQWLAQSELPTYDPENMYMVGGEYSAYIFAMDANGAVTINAYKGQITTGDVFIVSAFTIFPVIGEDVYVWNYTEPAYTFSGEVMTVTPTTAPEDAGVAPAKLSKNSKVKVMHKMANQKYVAKKFSSVLNLAK